MQLLGTVVEFEPGDLCPQIAAKRGRGGDQLPEAQAAENKRAQRGQWRE
jgi:hypothetical protein